MDELKGKASRGVDVTARIKVGPYLRKWIAGRKDLTLNTLTSYTGLWVPEIQRIWCDLLIRGVGDSSKRVKRRQ